MIKVNLNLERKRLNDEAYQFQCKFNQKILSDITLAYFEGEKSFDLEFSFQGQLGDFAELCDYDLLMLKKNENINERIQAYKKLNHYVVDLIKITIYGAEIAHKIYLEENKNAKQKNLNLKILSLNLNMGTSIDVLLFTLIKSIWNLIEFIPKNDLNVFLVEKIYRIINQVYIQNAYKLIIPYNFSTDLVSRDTSVDESLTNYFRGLDNEKFEKGRQFQWMI